MLNTSFWQPLTCWLCFESLEGYVMYPVLQTWLCNPVCFWYTWNWLSWNPYFGHYVSVTIIHCTAGSNVLSFVTSFLLMKDRQERWEGRRKEKRREGALIIAVSSLQSLGYVIQRDFLWFWKLRQTKNKSFHEWESMFYLSLCPGCSLEGLMLKLKLQYFGHLMRGVLSLEKTLMLGKIEGKRKRG